MPPLNLIIGAMNHSNSYRIPERVVDSPTAPDNGLTNEEHGASPKKITSGKKVTPADKSNGGYRLDIQFLKYGTSERLAIVVLKLCCLIVKLAKVPACEICWRLEQLQDHLFVRLETRIWQDR